MSEGHRTYTLADFLIMQYLMAKINAGRSAVTGKFVKQTYANKHPKTTVKEIVKTESKG